MTLFEFIEQIGVIIQNLSPSFWITVIIISPLFMWFEEIVQTIITKFLFIAFVKFPKKYSSIQMFLGFTDGKKYLELQGMHEAYEHKRTILEKLKISEDFLDETRGAMFVYNELSNIVFGTVVDKKEEGDITDSEFFDYRIIYKQDFSIKELREINESKILIEQKEGNRLFSISRRYSSKILRKQVYRKQPLIKLPNEFIESFKAKMMEVEGHFLENTEMYLFQKRLALRWLIFKVIIFIPFMFFLSELVEELLSFFELF